MHPVQAVEHKVGWRCLRCEHPGILTLKRKVPRLLVGLWQLEGEIYTRNRRTFDQHQKLQRIPVAFVLRHCRCMSGTQCSLGVGPRGAWGALISVAESQLPTAQSLLDFLSEQEGRCRISRIQISVLLNRQHSNEHATRSTGSHTPL